MPHLALALAVVVISGAAWLLVLRPLVSAPGSPGGSPSADEPGNETDGLALLPPIDHEPWDRVEWRAVEDAFGEPDALRRVDGLMDAGDVLVAWGRVPRPDRNQFNDMGAIFASRDGIRWREVAIDHGVNELSASTIGGVASGPLGFVAYGSVCCDPESPAMWHSADALTWQRLEIGGDVRGSITGIVAVEGGWVAHGTIPDGSADEIWFSADGEDWETVLHVEGGPLGASLWDVAVTPIGLVAVGTVTAPGGSYDGGAWASLDGRSWERIGEDDPALVGEGEVQLHSVIGHGGGIFVTGIFGTAEQRRQCEDLLGMVAGLQPPAGPPPAPDATTCMSGIEHQWTSADGAQWERIGPVPEIPVSPIEFRVMGGWPGPRAAR